MGTPFTEEAVTFRRTGPSAEYRSLRLLSETDVWELGLSPYVHGMRLRMGRFGRRPSVFDMCCGHDPLLAARALAAVLGILKDLPESCPAKAVDACFPWAGTRPDLAVHGPALFQNRCMPPS